MSAKKRGLGRGLDALLGAPADAGEDAEGELRELPLAAIHPNPEQPRRHFDEDRLAELAVSIRAQGVVQPIIVRPDAAGYQLVAGERRWRAAGQAGLVRIPALVRKLDARAAMATALVENIQRADLNPIEEAAALRRLLDDCGLTHERAAEALGRSRAAISNLLRLLDLPEQVQQWLREARLSAGHAKVLLGAPEARRLPLAQKVVALGLSVRQTEALVKAPLSARRTPAAGTHRELEGELSQRIGAPVTIRTGRGGGGRLSLKFDNAAELQRLVQRLR
ncbi:MAG: ParB/RepB/Spo0J family partition protein [Gammaproteobacteria bacterium]|nr:ParB/RepB/Spo0J family partition protein [Gammaproteobacteria bacterium]